MYIVEVYNMGSTEFHRFKKYEDAQYFVEQMLNNGHEVSFYHEAQDPE